MSIKLWHFCLLLTLPWSTAFQQSPGVLRIPESSFLNHYPHQSFRPTPRESTVLFATAREDDEGEGSIASSVWIFAVVPSLSLGLSLLLQAKLLLPLFIAKRLYIYLMAGTVLTVASIRGASDSPSLGTRLIDLTREILPDLSMDQNNTMSDERFQEMQVLDEVDGSAQAVGLPLIVVSSLVASLFFVLLQNGDFASESSVISPITSALPNLMTISNGIVVALFARAELKRGTSFLGDAAEPISYAGALLLSALAYFGPASLVWPVQNVLCICLAIAVSRAIQLPRLGPILLALSALVVYDVVSVGFQLVDLGAASLATQQGGGGEAASSAMGAVALSKAGLTSSTAGDGGSPIWQPGLFQVRLRGAVSDLLGLGDAVFPGLLSTFCLRYDQDNSQTNYFGASLAGFAVGCLACEFAPGVSNSGLPALLFIVPSMLTAVFGLAVLQGNISSLSTFDTEKASDA